MHKCNANNNNNNNNDDDNKSKTNDCKYSKQIAKKKRKKTTKGKAHKEMRKIFQSHLTRIHNGRMREREREREIRKERDAAQAFIALQANKAATTQTTTINGNA